MATRIRQPARFPLSDNDAVAAAQSMLGQDITAIKVKVGATDAGREIARLRLIRSVIGPQAALSADANEAGTWAAALRRVEQFDPAGVALAELPSQMCVLP